MYSKKSKHLIIVINGRRFKSYILLSDGIHSSLVMGPFGKAVLPDSLVK
jgi:hypothetical protein